MFDDFDEIAFQVNVEGDDHCTCSGCGNEHDISKGDEDE